MRSVMSHQFSQVPQVSIPRSTFDRSHGYKSTFDAGFLIPFYVDEVLPGDTFNVRATGLARLATPIFPIMDNMFLDTQFFAVPLRLIWSNFTRMMGEQPNPGDSTDFLVPQMTSPVGGYAELSLSDYLGLPIGVAGMAHSSLFHRAYNLVFNEWYRDENLQTRAVVDLDDGPDTPGDYVLRRRGKRHDYFTSCLPWPQKGNSVSLPLTGNAPVTGIGLRAGAATIATENVTETGGATVSYTTPYTTHGSPSFAVKKKSGVSQPEIYANLSAVTATTINSLRQAFQLQRLMERDARGGTRYIEMVKSHFGVTSPDARLQRPEYLGGGSSPVNITPVAATTNTSRSLGDLAGFGTSTFHSHGFVKSFTEHCIVLGILSVRADLTYQQGLNRMFSRRTRYDFYWPSLAMIGEQAVLNKEIYAQGTADDELTFGYQERYAEYRYKPSVITGQFRSTAATPLDAWHLSQEFTSLPALNSTFIEENPPIDRCIADVTDPHFVLDAFIQARCARPMPLYGVPGMIDHF